VESTTGDTGGTTAAGGSGGTTAAGGSGGAGGSVEGTCSAEEKAGAYDDPPKLGLAAPPGSPIVAVVVSVNATSLEYAIGPGAPVEVFGWQGPSLLDVFKNGESVTVGTSEGWHYVAGEKVAATYNDYQFVPPPALPAVPMSKAPQLGYVTQCFFPEGSGACGLPPASVDVLAVQVGTGPDAVTVTVGGTATAGEVTVHNVQSVALPGYGSDDCILEALFMTGVTVLAPLAK
jgi:hypothetical protein